MLINALSYLISEEFNLNLPILNDFFCKFQSYLTYANGPISPWLMVVLSFDRFMSIAFPKRFNFLFQFKFQVFIIGAVVAFNYIYYSFMIWNTVLVAGKYKNQSKNLRTYCQIIDMPEKFN